MFLFRTSTLGLAGTFAALSLVCAVVFTRPAAAVCDKATEQQVSIGFPGAVKKGDTYCVPINKNSGDLTQNPIFIFFKAVLQFAAGAVGLTVVGGLIWGAYLQITARGNSGQAEKAIETIRNSIIGLILFLFMFLIVNFLVPGGILR